MNKKLFIITNKPLSSRLWRHLNLLSLMLLISCFVSNLHADNVECDDSMAINALEPMKWENKDIALSILHSCFNNICSGIVIVEVVLSLQVM